MTQRRELKKYAKQAMSGKYGTLILAFVVVQALALISSVLSSALFPGEETLDLVLGYAFTFILTLLINVISCTNHSIPLESMQNSVSMIMPS